MAEGLPASCRVFLLRSVICRFTAGPLDGMERSRTGHGTPVRKNNLKNYRGYGWTTLIGSKKTFSSRHGKRFLFSPRAVDQ